MEQWASEETSERKLSKPGVLYSQHGLLIAETALQPLYSLTFRFFAV